MYASGYRPIENFGAVRFGISLDIAATIAARDMSRFTRYAISVCVLLLLLLYIGSLGVAKKNYAFDPLHFLERDTTFDCIRTPHDIAILVAVLAAATGIFSDLRRAREAGRIRRPWYGICVAGLVWLTGYMLLFCTVGVGFMCGGG